MVYFTNFCNSNIFTLAGLRHDLLFLKAGSQDWESKHSDVTDGEGMPILQAT